jgi:putative ubiquitin-RnfH superfamily antitoxin RatB of RatAB toxin-antitoxin module
MVKIELVYGDAKQQTLLTLEVAKGSCVRDVLQQTMPTAVIEQPVVGIFGQVVDLERVLQGGERIEVYRPLLVEPKQARWLLVQAIQKPVRPSRRGRGRRRKIRAEAAANAAKKGL